MSDPAPTPPIKFPPPKEAKDPINLSLPRRRGHVARGPFELSDASAAARQSIREIVTATRAPFGAAASSSEAEVRLADVEAKLRHLELSLAERERAVEEAEARLAERERDVAEAEALLQARESLVAARRQPPPATAGVSPEEKEALERVRAELERQEVSVREAKQAIREREAFLDESETKLFEKVQAQQEKEIELEQREEDLRARERRLREREAEVDPAAAAKLKADDEAAKQRDEFRE